MLDHVSLGVADLERSAAFYDAALAPLGYERVWTVAGAIGYGVAGGGDKLALKASDEPVPVPNRRCHLAFTASSERDVDAFFVAALAAGGTDDGAPGLRPHYGPGYYAAFVLDPDGYRTEAVFHDPAPDPAGVA